MKLLLIIPLLLSIWSSSQTVNDLRPTVTMKEYVDMNIDWTQKINNLRDEHQKEINRIRDENIKTAYTAQDKRLDGMNEFRQTIQDSNKTYVTWPALLGLIVGISGFIFGYSKHQREKKESEEKGSSSFIRSGDNVEVKK